MTARNLNSRLKDIEHRILRIYEAQSLLAFADDQQDHVVADLSLDAILYGLLVIGEAVRSLPKEFTDKHSDIPWNNIIGARNILAHEYSRVDARLVRATLDGPLETLLAVCSSRHSD